MKVMKRKFVLHSSQWYLRLNLGILRRLHLTIRIDRDSASGFKTETCFI